MKISKMTCKDPYGTDVVLVFRILYSCGVNCTIGSVMYGMLKPNKNRKRLLVTLWKKIYRVDKHTTKGSIMRWRKQKGWAGCDEV